MTRVAALLVATPAPGSFCPGQFLMLSCSGCWPPAQLKPGSPPEGPFLRHRLSSGSSFSPTATLVRKVLSSVSGPPPACPFVQQRLSSIRSIFQSVFSCVGDSSPEVFHGHLLRDYPPGCSFMIPRLRSVMAKALLLYKEPLK